MRSYFLLFFLIRLQTPALDNNIDKKKSTSSRHRIPGKVVILLFSGEFPDKIFSYLTPV